MGLPPSWKAEIQVAVEETIRAAENQRQANQNDAADNVVAAINSLSNAQNSQTSHEDRNEKKDRAISIATLFLVFLTVVFTFLTWRTLSGQLDEMKNAGEQTKQLIEANGKLAEAANKQATAAAENAKTARDSYVASQRAWVGPHNAKIDGDIAIGKPLKVVVEYQNTGREPALNFIYTGDVFDSTDEDETAGITFQKISASFRGCREAELTGGGTVVFPASGGFSSTGQALNITKPEFFVDQDMVDGKKTIVINGCFLYKSVGETRHSFFCYFYRTKISNTSNLNICTNGNGAD